MESYRILEQLGEGTCGTVYKALDLRTRETVAVKKMKRSFRSLEEFLAIREIKILRMFDHPNVIKLKAAFQENDEVNLIFEHMNYNLYDIMKERDHLSSPFSEDEIRSFLFQMLHGLSHIHEKGCFHRDLKPENLLVTDGVLKVADFGLAREASSMPPYTEYVSTRWYRAPEVLLQSNAYTFAVDMWAVGAILAELFTLSPIFPGGSEIDQLYKICTVLGTPELHFFSQAINTSRLVNLIINYEQILPANMFALIPNASSEAIDLMTRLLSWDPSRRPTADEALRHPFFQMAGARGDPLELTLSSMVPTGPTPNLELKLSDFKPEPERCFLGLTLGVNPSAPKLDVAQARNMVQDSLFNSGLDVHRETSDFWQPFSAYENDHFARVESSSLSQYIYGFPVHGEQSAFWPLISPEASTFFAPVQFPVLPLYSAYYDSSIQCPEIIGSQSTGFPIPELQLNIPVSEDPFRLCPRHSREGRCL